MLPIVQLGALHIRTYGLLLSLAALIIGMVGFHRLRRLGIAPELILRAGLPVIAAGFASVFLMYYVSRLPGLLPAGSVGRAGGMTIAWGVATAVAVAFISCRVYRLPVGRAFDLGVLACPLGQAIGRLGCLAAGCCAGKVTSSWLGVYLPGEGGLWAVRYPAPLLDGGTHLLIFLTLVAFERSVRGRRSGQATDGAASGGWPFDGFLFLLYLFFSSLVRFAMASLREGVTPLIGPFSAMHLQGIAGAGLAMTLVFWNLARSTGWGTNLRRGYGS